MGRMPSEMASAGPEPRRRDVRENRGHCLLNANFTLGGDTPAWLCFEGARLQPCHKRQKSGWALAPEGRSLRLGGRTGPCRIHDGRLTVRRKDASPDFVDLFRVATSVNRHQCENFIAIHGAKERMCRHFEA